MSDDYRIALRPAGEPPQLDDVAVRDVSVFRAERLDRDQLWMACYLSESEVPVTFAVSATVDDDGVPVLEFAVTETPAPSERVVYEAGSMTEPPEE